MNRFRNFMAGRYGTDVLNLVLLAAAIVLTFITVPFLWIISLVLIAVSFFRMFSKNIYKRQAENMAFTGFFIRIGRYFKSRKAHMAEMKVYCFFRCPKCRQKVRVPKGKGKISITCPKCGEKFIKKT